jgi:uncharacterized protein (TIGR02453 family)
MNAVISEEVFNFLKSLEVNNNRDWFNTHKSAFKALEKEVKLFNKDLAALLNQHDQIDRVKMFRIYRDVRFSKNKLPYKTHFGTSFHRVKPQLRGGYYVHLQPNDKSFLGVGFWDPSKEDLLRIRKEFETDDSEIRSVLADPDFNKLWGDFVGETLKTAPKGFSKDHHAIDLIRRKQYIFTKTFSDQEVLDDDFTDQVNTAFKGVRPFFDLMSDILTTDLNGVSLI